ncbi:hypothetical protein [Shewanella polaris]|uniref:Uncharacterized protein n=1 Tax=Shewanella polaris TaxID=2588449 RepID=A0A4Y5YIV4_9GAMM|nr:hypothetical protein [Shewanella polaris]QDE32740.1 hypothetical protein FH971_18290 [Shewanella polaris]
MDIVTLCIVLIILQPIIVYFAFFKNIAATTKYNEFYQSFLVLPPSLSLFYTDQYWSALGLLIGVTVVGIVLAKMINHKANPPIALGALTSLTISWFILVGFGHLVADAFSSSTLVVSIFDIITSPKGIYSALLMSFYYLAAMLVLIFIRVLEKKFTPKEELSGVLLLILSFIGGALPAMADYFVLSTFLNVFILYLSSGVIIRSDDDSSAGAIGFMYAYLFTMGVGVCLLYQGGMWLYRVVG